MLNKHFTNLLELRNMNSDAQTYSMNKNIIQENITTYFEAEMFLFCTLWTWVSVPCEFCSKLLDKDALLRALDGCCLFAFHLLDISTANRTSRPSVFMKTRQSAASIRHEHDNTVFYIHKSISYESII